MPYYVDVVLNMISKFPLLYDKIILINCKATDNNTILTENKIVAKKGDLL